MGLLLPYLITKHLQEWFFIFVLKSGTVHNFV